MSLRKELKHDFLKQIIFRVDFKGLLDRDVDKCISEIRESLFNNGFVNDDARVESREEEEGGWLLKTPKRTRAAQFEHTVVITEGKPIIVTKL